MKIKIIIPALMLIVFAGFTNQVKVKAMATKGNDQKFDTATFGEGCFWCTEAVFERLEGVREVVSGYSGGTVKKPSYEQVCTGNTGHAEVCRIIFDPGVISYEELLDVFWHTHDPTTLNRQGNDAGTQYRSVIFYHNDEQKAAAEASLAKEKKSGDFKNPIVTEISPLTNFYEAEGYHQEYFANHPDRAYCSMVIAPKVKKFKAKFADKLK